MTTEPPSGAYKECSLNANDEDRKRRVECCTFLKRQSTRAYIDGRGDFLPHRLLLVDGVVGVVLACLGLEQARPKGLRHDEMTGEPASSN